MNKERLSFCHDKTFQVARKIEAVGKLLENVFEADDEVTLYGLALILEQFGDELTEVYRELDEIRHQTT